MNWDPLPHPGSGSSDEPPSVKAHNGTFRADIQALFEEQRQCLALDIRESIERHTKAIDRLIEQQGQLEQEVKLIQRPTAWGSHPEKGNNKTTTGCRRPSFDSYAPSEVQDDQGCGISDKASACSLTGAPDLAVAPHEAPKKSVGIRDPSFTMSANMSTIEYAQLRASKVAELLKDRAQEQPKRFRSCWCNSCTLQCYMKSFSEFRKGLKMMVLSTSFDLFCGGLILCNAALIGVEVEYQAHHEGISSPVLSTFQTMFGVIFLVELLLRLHAEGRNFLRPPGWKWNAFDLVLVSTFVADFASASEGSDLSSSFAGRILRAARFCRILRTLRLVRATSYAYEFRKMAYALQHSAHTLIWALLLLFVVIYCFATTFTQAATDFLSNTQTFGSAVATSTCNPLDGTTNDDRYRRECELLFFWSTLPKSIYTLYSSLCGGVNWTYVVESLGHADWMFKALFIVYISVSFFGVLNVVTSVFVECAMASTQHFMDIKIQEALNMKKMHIQHLKEVFRDVDDDGSGDITITEMEELLKNEHLSAYLESIDIRKDDARLLFQLLDEDGSGMISINEFCEGCLRLKGEAKSFDIHRLVWENKKLMKKLGQYTDQISQRITGVNVLIKAMGQRNTNGWYLQDQTLAPSTEAQPSEVEVEFHRQWGADATAEIQNMLFTLRNGNGNSNGRHLSEGEQWPSWQVQREVFGI